MGKLADYPRTYCAPRTISDLNGHAVGLNAVYAAIDLRLRYAPVVFFVATRSVAWAHEFNGFRCTLMEAASVEYLDQPSKGRGS